jgi:hypothetical protein
MALRKMLHKKRSNLLALMMELVANKHPGFLDVLQAAKIVYFNAVQMKSQKAKQYPFLKVRCILIFLNSI